MTSQHHFSCDSRKRLLEADPKNRRRRPKGRGDRELVHNGPLIKKISADAAVFFFLSEPDGFFTLKAKQRTALSAFLSGKVFFPFTLTGTSRRSLSMQHLQLSRMKPGIVWNNHKSIECWYALAISLVLQCKQRHHLMSF